MSIAQRVGKNTLVLYASQIISTLLSVVLVAFMARILGAANYGVISFAMIFTALFGILTNLGTNELLIREVSKNTGKASKYLGNIAVIRLILSIVVVILIITTINFMNYPSETLLVVSIFSFYTVITSLAALFRVIFRAFERMKYEALVSLIVKTISFSLGMTALFAGYGIVQLAFTFLIAGIFDLLLSISICIVKFARPQLEVDWGFWKNTLRIAFPFALSNIFTMAYIRIDTVMLSAMKGDVVVGWYNAAYNPMRALTPITLLFMTAVFPVMSRLFVSSKDSLAKSYEKSIKYLLILGLPVSIGLVALADKIIPFLYAEGFAPSIITLQILGWDFLLIAMYRPMLYLLASINRQGYMALVAGIGAVVNIGLNLILIPSLSYVGAGIATITSESFIVGASWYFTSRFFYKLPIHKIILKPLFASVVMGSAVYLLNRFTDLNLFLLIALAIVLYFILVYIMKTFTKEDKELFQQIIRIRSHSTQ
ncbi:flippase [Chloroflexota bacterium]